MHQIREYQEKDLPAIVDMIKELAVLIGMGERATLTVEQLRKDRDIFNCLVVEDDAGAILGIATHFYAYFSWVGKAMFLDDLIVREAYRGKGIGNGLFDAIVEKAKANQCKRLSWEVTRDNHHAQAFYRAKGAEIDADMMVCQINF
ncbi:MAG: GNAT family N-acetyltransferase [Bacteroidota bacterium]